LGTYHSVSGGPIASKREKEQWKDGGRGKEGKEGKDGRE